MSKIAIVISTKYGQTRKIARRIEERLRLKSHQVLLIEPDKNSKNYELSVSQQDVVVFGAPVYAGKFSKSLTKWANEHASELTKVSTAFFSVSLNAADTRPEARKEDQRLISEFLSATHLNPAVTTSLIGTVHYRKYGLLTRWLLRNICRKAGGPTDTSRDHELTDWVAVDAFADQIAALP